MTTRRTSLISPVVALVALLGVSLIPTAWAGDDTVAKNIAFYSKVWDEILNDRDINQINAVNFADNVTVHLSEEDVVGIEGTKAFYQNYLTGFSDIEFSIIEIVGQRDRVVKHWRFKGKHTGVFFGIPATGRDLDIQGITLARIENGKIVEEQDFMDNMDMMTQLGQLDGE